MSDKKILRVVGCIVKHDDDILMLFRTKKETDPSLWGIPAGKVEPGESDLDAAARELFEETGIRADAASFVHLGELPIEYPTLTVIFPVFELSLDQKPDIILQPREHIDYKWMSADQILAHPDLMQDVDVIIESFAK
jgi:8-oxo-dGTP diphosphatase